MDDADQDLLPRSAKANRVLALLVMLGCAAPLVLAATLTPSGAGMGTHTQLGLPDCGFKVVTGLPCATCGCTTAFAYAADGSILHSFVTQPFGAVLAVVLAMATWVGVWGVWSGMPVAPVFSALSQRRLIIAWVVLLFAAWGYKAAVVWASW